MSRPTNTVTRTQGGVHLTFDASSASKIEQHLQRLALADAAHFKDVRQEMGEWLLGQVQDNFDKQRLWDGSPMPQSKAAIRRKGKTLIKTHRLYDSYVYQLVGDSVEVGSALIYARIHHFGGATSMPSKHGPTQPIKARPVLGVTDAMAQRMGNFLINELKRLQ